MMEGTGITRRVNAISDTSTISLEDKMTTARIEVTGSCTLNCKFCYNSTLKKNNIRQKMMNRDAFLKVVNELDNVGTIKEVGCFYMGEPGMHPLLEDFYKILKDKGYFTYLTTNGTVIKNILPAIPYIDSLKVSWNYIDVEDFIRKTGMDDKTGPFYYRIIKSNMKTLYNKCHECGKSLAVSTVVDYGEHPRDYTMILKILPYDEHYFMPVQNQCGLYRNGEGGVVGEYYHQAHKIPCWSLFRGFYVDVDLNVRTCSYGHTDEHILGNIRTGYDLSKLEEYKKDHLNGIIPSICKSCIQ